jgi:DNA-binding CsgD family transcriptional regulator
LADRFALLTGGRRGALPRHRTLEASMDWSHALLRDEERVLLRRLSIFARGFDLGAAEAICAGGGLERWAVLDALTGLVDRSLALVDDELSRGRYRLLETIRHFAFAKLTDAGEVAIVRDAHLDHYLTRARQAERDLEGPEAVGVLARLEADVDNFRSAHDWAIQSARVEQARELASGLWLFWQRDRGDEGIARLQAALAPSDGEPLARAKAVQALADLLYYRGDLVESGRYSAESLPLAEASGDDRTVGRAERCIGANKVFLHQPGALTHVERALVLHRSTNDFYFWIESNIVRALAGWFTGDSELVRRSANEAMGVGRRSANPTLLSRALTLAVIEACACGDLDRWEAPANEAIALALEQGDEVVGTIALGFLARLHALRGNHDAGLKAAEAALVRAQAVNNVQGTAIALWAKATTEHDIGRASALATLAHAWAVTSAVGLSPIAGECADAMVRTAISRGDMAEARVSASAAAQVADGPYGQGARGWALQIAAELALADDKPDEAAVAIHDGLVAWTKIGNHLGVVSVLELLVRLDIRTNRMVEAARLRGATDTERERSQWPVAPVDRERHASDWSVLCAAMGIDALAIAYAEGAAMDVNEAVAYGRRGRGARRKAVFGWSSLTPTEREVVRLATEGLRNADIAERLFMSPVTAKSHIAHVFVKLGVHSRAALVAYAIPRLTDPV